MTLSPALTEFIMATPTEVRAELRKRKLPYDINKSGGTWYVYGADANIWHTSSLNTYRLDGLTAVQWVDEIVKLSEQRS